jgi:hypothetical protein
MFNLTGCSETLHVHYACAMETSIILLLNPDDGADLGHFPGSTSALVRRLSGMKPFALLLSNACVSYARLGSMQPRD